MSTKQKQSPQYTPLDGGGLNKTKSVGVSWKLEITCMLASIGCMVAIIVILNRMKDRPLYQWTFFISLNATIAIFITIVKSTAMSAVSVCISQSKWLYFKTSPRKLRELDLHEWASRGPAGSSWLLLTSMPWKLATIGAVITILALGIDAFVQQVVSVDSQNVAIDDGKASFGLARNYSGGAHASTGIFWAIDASTIDSTMQGALYRGLFNMTLPLALSCGSSCIWNSTYVSFGFTAFCADVTAATIKTAISRHSDSGWNLTTPGGLDVPVSYSPTSHQTVTNVVTKSLVDTSITQGRPQRPEIVRVAILRAPSDHRSWSMSLDTIEVYECTFGFAAYKYSNISAVGSQFDVGSMEKVQLEEAYYDVSDGDNYFRFNQTGLPIMTTRAADVGGLVEMFTSSRFSGIIYDGESQPAAPEGMGFAFITTNVSQVFDNVATSMTDQLRSRYDVVANGLTVQPVVFVRVQWAWLALPIFVQLTSLVFLILIMIKSRHVQPWKDSIIAVLSYYLVHDADNTAVTLRTDISTLSDLDKLAKIRTKLE